MVEAYLGKNPFPFRMEPSESKVKMVKFNNGEHYPMLGLGTWQVTHGTETLFLVYIYYDL